MKFKKIKLSTMLSDLYGRDGYQSHIELGRDYWYYFGKDSEIEVGWHKIRVTYIRSGCMFYCFPDFPDVKERFCPIDCYMASALVFAEIDPTKDLNDFSESEEKLYYFDTEHTVVKNWSNEAEIEVDKNKDAYLAATLSVLGKQID